MPIFEIEKEESIDTVAEWLKALDCKSGDLVYAGSNPAHVNPKNKVQKGF